MRLIDADKLKADIEQFNRPLCDDYHMKDYVLNQIITDIENQPTVDAVPVIRCKDCKYWLPHSQFGFDEDNEEYYDYCELLVPDDDYYAITRRAEDYCSRAEREEE